MLRWTTGFVAVAGFCTTLLGAPSREDIAYVAMERAVLSGLPDAAAAPPLAEVLRGTALHVLERRDGMVRVACEGWMAEGALAKEPPWPVAPTAPKGDETKPAEKPPVDVKTLPPVADLALAHHLDIEAAAEGRGETAQFTLRLSLRTMLGRAVVVTGERQEGTLTFFVQRRIAGGRVRGMALLEKPFTLVDGVATLSVRASEVKVADDVAELLISGRATLPGPRELHGAAVDVLARAPAGR